MLPGRTRHYAPSKFTFGVDGRILVRGVCFLNNGERTILSLSDVLSMDSHEPGGR
jgi:hypothetical protein